MTVNLFDFSVMDANGKDTLLSNLKGKVTLVVNVASKCGFTSQYEGLEKIHEKFRDQGFSVLAFPCNQFGGQEPASDEEIQNFCQTNYSVKFPVFAKIEVNGPKTAPLFEFLKASAPGILGTEMIKWNFTKFLIDRNGKVIDRYPPQLKPEELIGSIQAALQDQQSTPLATK